MTTPKDSQAAVRWLQVENTESTPAPPFAVVEVVGISDDGNAATVRRPTTASLAPARLLVLGPGGMPASARAVGHASFPGLACYKASGGLVSLAGTLGTEANSYKLKKGNTGFRALEATVAGQDVLLVAADDTSVVSAGTLVVRDATPVLSVTATTLQIPATTTSNALALTEPTSGVAQLAALSASGSQYGVVTTLAQTFAGDKSLVDDLLVYGGGLSALHVQSADLGAASGAEAYIDTGVNAGSWTLLYDPGSSDFLFFTLAAPGGASKALDAAYRIKVGATTYTGQSGTYAGLEFHGGILKGGSYTGTTGTVTSVAMSVPSILSVSGSPVTTTGTLAVTLANQSANTLFAGPTSGGAATPTFRAQVVADLPALTGLTAADAALADEVATYNAAATANRKLTLTRVGGLLGRLAAPGRLSLDTNDPFGALVSSQINQTSLYYIPCFGSALALYDGSTRWEFFNISKLTLASPSLTSGLPYDVYAYNNSGTPTLELTAWSSATGRATDPVLQDGVLVKTGATTRRYLGTILASGTNQMTDSTTFRGVWNWENQAEAELSLTCSGSGYTYSTATIRQCNADTANKFTVVSGYGGKNLVSLQLTVYMITTVSSSSAAVMIGTATNTDNSTGYAGSHNVRSDFDTAYYGKNLVAGTHVFYANERGAGSGTQTWYPQSGASFSGRWMC